MRLNVLPMISTVSFPTGWPLKSTFILLITPFVQGLILFTDSSGPASTQTDCLLSAIVGRQRLGRPLFYKLADGIASWEREQIEDGRYEKRGVPNSVPTTIILFAKSSVVSGWTVEQSTKSFPLTPFLSIVSVVSLTAASSPTQVKMMSDFEMTSFMEEATTDFPDGKVLLKSSARSRFDWRLWGSYQGPHVWQCFYTLPWPTESASIQRLYWWWTSRKTDHPIKNGM